MAGKSKGEVRPIFPAGAVARYRNPAHGDIAVDDFSYAPNYASTTESTSQDLNILDEPRFSRLRAFLEECVADYLDNVYCYAYESFQRLHTHGNSIVSGVYYLKADPRRSAPLMFEKAEGSSFPYLAVAAKEQTIFTANRMAYPSESGICYLFPSHIKHGYETPSSGGERISLAFNVMLTGIGLFYRM